MYTGWHTFRCCCRLLTYYRNVHFAVIFGSPFAYFARLNTIQRFMDVQMNCQCVRELGPAPVFVVQAICIPINSNVCTKFHCCCWLHTYMQCILFTLTFVYCCSVNFPQFTLFRLFYLFQTQFVIPYKHFVFIAFFFQWILKHFYLLNIFFYNLAVGLTQLRTKFTPVDWIFKISTDNAMHLSVVPTGDNSQNYLMTVLSFRFSHFDT